jgi:hypothetical protein
MKTFAILLFILAIPISAYSSYDVTRCFPGDKKIYSPSGKHSISWEEPKNEDDTHHIFYEGDTKTELLAFYRSVCVHWSPTEKFFALTDYTGSNISEVLIFSSDSIKKPRKIVDYLPEVAKAKFSKSSHGYVEVTGWNDKCLSVRVWGNTLDTSEPFEFIISCDVDSKTIKCNTTK